MKPTYRRSWAGNLLMFSDLTLGPSFKVKQWFTGFGELSFRWIQICIGSPMRRSSCLWDGFFRQSDTLFAFQHLYTQSDWQDWHISFASGLLWQRSGHIFVLVDQESKLCSGESKTSKQFDYCLCSSYRAQFLSDLFYI